jgi:hypothetical protein
LQGEKQRNRKCNEKSKIKNSRQSLGKNKQTAKQTVFELLKAKTRRKRGGGDWQEFTEKLGCP